MPRSSPQLLLAILALAMLGCDQAPTAPAAPEAETRPELVTTLDFRAPQLTASDLRTVSEEMQDEPHRERPPAVIIEEDAATSIPQIIEPRTRVGFEEGRVFAGGIHKYTSNVGEIETTVQVTHANQHLGSHTAVKRIYDPFYLNIFRRNAIFAWAWVYTDHECGLTLNGSSVHSASWEFFQGTSTQSWGHSKRSTQATPASQGSCAQSVGTGTGVEEGPSGVLCYYLITYDLDTGEILHAEFLYCSSTGGEMI